jgi:hypothetical protein
MKRRIALLSAAVLMLSAIGFGTASAAGHLEPETVPGNDTCEGTKIEPVVSGTYALAGGGTVTITVRDTDDGPVFDFDASADITIGSVTVKGGTNHNLYIFAPAVNSAEGLHAPINPKNDKYFGLSHLCFEDVKKDDKK